MGKINHCILVKWNETVTEKEALLPGIRAIFDRTKALDGVYGLKYLTNVTDRPNRYDLMIVVTMEEAALPAYDKSEPHLTWKETYSGLIAAKAIFDCAESAWADR